MIIYKGLFVILFSFTSLPIAKIKKYLNTNFVSQFYLGPGLRICIRKSGYGFTVDSRDGWDA